MSGPRVGLIGPRRRRQGLGPFVARDLLAAGAELPCFLATSAETLELAQRELHEKAGLQAKGYLGLEEMLAAERLDALAILSPAETHEHYLAAAAAAGLHVLCEKPLVWAADSLAARGRARVEAFRSRGLLLAENCQWPYTLEAFRRLHPGTGAGPPKSFAMRLSPTSAGRQQLGDCLPHPLSVLQALAPSPGPSVENVAYTRLDASEANLGVRFDYCADGARVAVDLELQQGEGFPRAASLEIDGRRAERRIELPAYDMAFADGDRTVELPDPLTARIRAFAADLEAVRSGAPAPDPAPIVHRLAMLDTLADAYPGRSGAR